MALPDPKVVADALRVKLAADVLTGVVKWDDRVFDPTDANLPSPHGSVVGSRVQSAAVYIPKGWECKVTVGVALVVRKMADQRAAEAQLQTLSREVHRVILANESLDNSVDYVDGAAMDLDGVANEGIAWMDLSVVYSLRTEP